MPDDVNDFSTNYGGQGSRTSDWAQYQDYRKKYRSGNDFTDVGNFLVRGTLGGPVGQGEAMSGHAGTDLLGLHVGNGTTLDDTMTEDVYNSMSPAEWEHFAHLDRGSQREFITSRQKEIQRSQPARDAAAKAKADALARDKWTSEQQAKVQKFADEMGMGVDELLAKGDTGMSKVADTAVNTSQRGAYSRGLGSGGVSTLNTQRAMGDAMNNYVFARQQAGNSARMGLLQQIEGTREYNQGIDLQLQQARAGAQNQAYQQAMQQAGGPMGMVGAAAGAYFGGPSGAQAGYQIGSGIGQNNYQQSNPYKPYQYKNNYGTGGGLGSGGGQ